MIRITRRLAAINRIKNRLRLRLLSPNALLLRIHHTLHHLHSRLLLIVPNLLIQVRYRSMVPPIDILQVLLHDLLMLLVH